MKHRSASLRVYEPTFKGCHGHCLVGDCQRWKLCSHSCRDFFLVTKEHLGIEQCFCCEGKAKEGSRQTSVVPQQPHAPSIPTGVWAVGATASAWVLQQRESSCGSFQIEMRKEIKNNVDVSKLQPDPASIGKTCAICKVKDSGVCTVPAFLLSKLTGGI